MKYAGVILVFTGLSMAIILIAGNFISIDGQTVNQKLFLKLWFLKNEVLGPDKIGIYEADPVMGWRHEPLSSGRDFAPYAFDVRYAIDDHGNRVTPGSYDQPKVVFLGCSFTFGHGVEDEEAYVYLLGSSFPERKMINAAVNGWGTVQSWLRLEELLQKYDDIDLVVYGMIGHHYHRNYLRRSWLETLEKYGRQNSRVELIEDKLVKHGLSNASIDGQMDSDSLSEKEQIISLALLKDMKTMCNRQGIPFLLVQLPDGGNHDATVLQNATGNEYFVDLRPLIDYQSIKNNIDGHPTKAGHKEIAQRLENHIKSILGK